MAEKINSLDDIREEKIPGKEYEYNGKTYKLCSTCDGRGYDSDKKRCWQCIGEGVLIYLPDGCSSQNWKHVYWPKVILDHENPDDV